MTIIQLPLLAMSYNEALCSLNLPSYKIICPISTIYIFCIKLHLSFSGPTFFMVSGNTDTWLCYLSVCYSQSTKSCCSLVSYLINFNQRQCRKYSTCLLFHPLKLISTDRHFYTQDIQSGVSHALLVNTFLNCTSYFSEDFPSLA